VTRVATWPDTATQLTAAAEPPIRNGVETVVLAVEYGPVGVWVGGIATFLAALVALWTAMGRFDRFRAPRLVLTFEPREPWCRNGTMDTAEVMWVRMAITNEGRFGARSCVGRLMSLSSRGVERADVDPVQLRWAGVPRSRSFDPIDLRPGQREFLNLVALVDHACWRIITFDDVDFDPGFTTELDASQQHVLHLAVSADNADTVKCSIGLDAATHTAALEATRADRSRRRNRRPTDHPS
jgi:hypothetical protein